MIDYNTLIKTTLLIRKNNAEWIECRSMENSFPITPEMYESATWNADGKKLTIGNDCYDFYSYADVDKRKINNDTAPYEALKEVMDVDSLAYAINTLEVADIVMVESNWGTGICTSAGVDTDILYEISEEIANMDKEDLEEIDPESELPVGVLFYFNFEAEQDDCPLEIQSVVYNLPFMENVSDGEKICDGNGFCCPAVTTDCESGVSDDDWISVTPLKQIQAN